MLPHEQVSDEQLTTAVSAVRSYYAALGIAIRGWAQNNASVHCFADADAHRREDCNPSCSVNLEHGAWHCHGCGAKGGAYDAAIALGYSSRAAIDLMVAHGLVQRRGQRAGLAPATQPRKAIRRMQQCTESDVRHWQTALTGQTQLIAKLARERGWSYDVMSELGLGYNSGRVTIPVRDGAGGLCGLLQYRPSPETGQAKMLAAPGTRRQILPHPAAQPAKTVLLVEGEPDMIAARSRGIPAIALPGVDSWRTEWAQLLNEYEVIVLMDADEPGRRAAQRIAGDLSQRQYATVIDLSPSRDDGYDLTDWLLERPERSARDLITELAGLTLR